VVEARKSLASPAVKSFITVDKSNIIRYRGVVNGQNCTFFLIFFFLAKSAVLYEGVGQCWLVKMTR
jgi:hypothetical protein